MEARPREIRVYETADGKRPFTDWMDRLRGSRIHGIILTRLDRVQKGNLGNCGRVGEGVSELRIDFGPGYRIYFGQDRDQVVLVGGGTKGTQAADIAKAKEYWRDYNA